MDDHLRAAASLCPLERRPPWYGIQTVGEEP